MWQMKSDARVYLALGGTDMRKAINGLSMIVDQNLGHQACSGDLYAFCNRNKTILKILYWGKSGFCLWHKRLERDKFRWPETEKEVLEVTCQQLAWLLDGLDISQAHEHLEYSVIG